MRSTDMDDMLQNLIDIALAHTPIDEREHRSLSQFVEIVPTLLQPFSEHADPTHVTASAMIISADHGSDRIVLHKHKRLGLWLQPGGHIDDDESVPDAAVREAQEETGLVVRHVDDHRQFVHIDVHPGPRGHTHLDLRYLLEALDDVPAPAPGESPDVAWFSFDEALAVADEALVGALRAVRARG
jgi:8-oxo-dGTP pyrophosphatase MutT (NUDIX family)